MERVEGWPARTDAPLGAIPFVLGGVVCAVVAIVFTSAIAWAGFALSSCILAARAIRWVMRQLEAVQLEREVEQIVQREPRLVPLFHAPRWDERRYHKAS